jgi:hypothetical protein
LNVSARSLSKDEANVLWLLILSSILYVAACLLPALDDGPSEPWGVPGFLLLLFGWAAIPSPVAIPWSANALLLAAVICLWLGRYRTMATLAGFATLFSLSTWLIELFVPAKPRIGAYVWLASLICVCVASGIACQKLTPARGRK